MTDVTVIVATYNRPDMLRVELESILASAALVKESVRVLVVDDCSRSMAAQGVAASLGVDYMRNPRNLGIAGTLAAGYAATDSPFTTFWGDDDYMLPNYLPLHLAKIAEGYDVVSGSYWWANPSLVPKRAIILEPVTLSDLRKGIVKANDGSLIRRSALEGIPWRPERERAMMMTMWLALATAGRKFATLTEPTWYYRRHRGNMSARGRQTEHDRELRRQAMAEYAA